MAVLLVMQYSAEIALVHTLAARRAGVEMVELIFRLASKALASLREPLLPRCKQNPSRGFEFRARQGYQGLIGDRLHCQIFRDFAESQALAAHHAIPGAGRRIA